MLRRERVELGGHGGADPVGGGERRRIPQLEAVREAP
jgi:hypothetical protein